MNLIVKVVFVMMLLASPAQAANIIQIAVDERAIPFLLDDEGHVWGFEDPHTGLEVPVKLPNLEHIKKIAPYIALDDKGQVYTWTLNLDEMVWEDGDISEVGYTNPKKVESLRGVTSVAQSINHFFAVINGHEIVAWQRNVSKKGSQDIGYGPIKTLYSGRHIKAISAAPGSDILRNTLVSIKRGNPKAVQGDPSELEQFPDTPYGLVALLDDGTVMGWGITATGQVSKEIGGQSVVLTQSPGAISIAMNGFHTVVLTAQGIPKFWGGCDLYGSDGMGKPFNPGNVQGVDGFVSDVVGMALTQVMLGWGGQGTITTQQTYLSNVMARFGCRTRLYLTHPMP